jgi:hypothetical protein
MHIKAFLKLCLFMSLVYVTLGDSFLPQPYNSNSKAVREDINEFLIGLLPDKKFHNLKRTALTIEEFEQGKFSASY